MTQDLQQAQIAKEEQEKRIQETIKQHEVERKEANDKAK